MTTSYVRYPSITSGLTTGNLTDAGTDGIVVTGGTGAVIGTGTSLAQHVADTTHNGYLSSTDWNTFNGKQASGSYITALTGDVAASGPGSAAATIQAGAVDNSKVSASAAIAYSKLASLTSAHILVGSAGNVATDTAVTGDVTITNAGVTAIGTNKVANSQLAQMAANSIKGNNTGGAANAADLTVAQTNTLLGTLLTTTDQTATGVKTFSSGVQFATTSGTPATLNYYEEGTFTANFNQGAGASGTNTSYTVNFVRIGKMVILVFPAVQPTAGATAATFSTASGTVPATLRPTTSGLFWMNVGKVNGADSATPVQTGISTSGVLSVQRDGAGATTFTNGSVSGPYGFTMSYTIQ